MSTALGDLHSASPNQSLTASIIRNVLNSIRSEGGTLSGWDVREADERSDNSPFAGYGAISAQGLSKHMEDSFHVQETLASPGLSEPQTAQPQPLQQQSTTEDSFSLSGGFSEDLAFFSVFDGHGGDEVAQHCSDRLHQHFTRLLLSDFMSPDGADVGNESNLATIAQTPATSAGPAESAGAVNAASPAFLPTACSTPMRPNTSTSCPTSAAAATTEAAAQVASPSTPPCAPHHGRHPSGSRGMSRPCHPSLVTAALRTSFHLTDTELAGTDEGEFVGATAVVAVVGRRHIWVAHCGDSRAVMQRNGDAVALTSDHKPDREDEADRIKAAGGRIVFNGGTRRVNGMLAMTRSIGDHYLRPFVIADPEVTCMERTVEDEVLIIATDGLWDVFGVTEATHLASRCISRSKERGMPKHGACRVAASVLANTALERGSRDNITVIVVDVSLPSGGADAGGEEQGSGEPVVASSVQEELEPVASSGAGSNAAVGEGSEDDGAEGAGRSGVLGAGGAPMQMRSATSMGKYMLLKSQSRGEVGGGPGASGSSGAAASPRQVCSHADLTRLCSAGRQQEDASGQRQLSGQGSAGSGGAGPGCTEDGSNQLRHRAAISGGGASPGSICTASAVYSSPCSPIGGAAGGSSAHVPGWSSYPSRLSKGGDLAAPAPPLPCSPSRDDNGTQPPPAAPLQAGFDAAAQDINSASAVKPAPGSTAPTEADSSGGETTADQAAGSAGADSSDIATQQGLPAEAATQDSEEARNRAHSGGRVQIGAPHGMLPTNTLAGRGGSASPRVGTGVVAAGTARNTAVGISSVEAQDICDGSPCDTSMAQDTDLHESMPRSPPSVGDAAAQCKVACLGVAQTGPLQACQSQGSAS